MVLPLSAGRSTIHFFLVWRAKIMPLACCLIFLHILPTLYSTLPYFYILVLICIHWLELFRCYKIWEKNSLILQLRFCHCTLAHCCLILLHIILILDTSYSHNKGDFYVLALICIHWLEQFRDSQTQKRQTYIFEKQQHIQHYLQASQNYR